MRGHTCVVMLEKVLDFVMMSNIAKGNTSVDPVVHRVFGGAVLLGVTFLK